MKLNKIVSLISRETLASEMVQAFFAFSVFTVTSWYFFPASAIMKLHRAFLCVVCGQGRKKLCAGGNRSLTFLKERGTRRMAEKDIAEKILGDS